MVLLSKIAFLEKHKDQLLSSSSNNRPVWQIIINPTAGNGRAKKRWPQIKNELERQKVKFNFTISEHKEAIAQIVPDLINNGARGFVAVGGDGTLHQIVNAILDQNTIPSREFTVGIIPFGTGNDWIRSHGIEGKISKAIAVIKNGNTKLQDVGLIQSENFERRFINMVGLGLTPFVIRQYISWGKRLKLGSLNYLITTAISLFKYRGAKYHLSADESDFQFNAKLLSFNIGIGQYCGGGIRLAPLAVADDQYFDFTLIHPLAVWRILTNIGKLFNGKILKHPKVDHYRGASVTISAQEAFHLEADGELIPKAKVFSLSLLPQYLSVVVP